MEPIKYHAHAPGQLDDGMSFHWNYTPESAKWHEWADMLPLGRGRLICMACKAEHQITEWRTGRFCPVRLAAPTTDYTRPAIAVFSHASGGIQFEDHLN